MNLREQITEKKRQAADLMRHARMPAACPREVHESEVQATQLLEQVRQHEMHLSSNDSLAVNIETLVRYLEKSRIQSRERALVFTRLEEALMWVERESGRENQDFKTQETREEKKMKNGQDARAPL